MHWYFDSHGEIDVYFSVEKLTLFPCLKSHLPSEQLWESFRQLKKQLSKGLKDTDLTQEGKAVFISDASSPASEVVNELEIALAKTILPGKCPACPEEA